MEKKKLKLQNNLKAQVILSIDGVKTTFDDCNVFGDSSDPNQVVFQVRDANVSDRMIQVILTHDT